MTLGDELALLDTDVGFARIPRDVVLVTGPDAVAFLHGQLSQDIAGLAVGSSAWSFVLEPQGKVDAWFRASRVADDEVVLDVDAGFGAVVEARLRRFLLRTKADIAVAEWELIAVRGPRTDDVEAVAPIVEDAGWAAGAGLDLVGPELLDPPGVEQVSDAALEVLRVVSGIPSMAGELSGGVIPGETGLIDRSVSFTKGCYTGQELVARVDSRGGNVPRRLHRLVVDSAAPLDALAGATLHQDGAEVGVITSAVWSPREGSHVALGYLRRAADPDAPLDVGGHVARSVGLVG